MVFSSSKKLQSPPDSLKVSSVQESAWCGVKTLQKRRWGAAECCSESAPFLLILGKADVTMFCSVSLFHASWVSAQVFLGQQCYQSLYNAESWDFEILRIEWNIPSGLPLADPKVGVVVEGMDALGETRAVAWACYSVPGILHARKDIVGWGVVVSS